MHGMHIINPHRRHANRALTLKCIVRIWTSSGRSVDSLHMLLTVITFQGDTAERPQFPGPLSPHADDAIHAALREWEGVIHETTTRLA